MSKSVSNFLLKRRSVTAKTMLASVVTIEDLDINISSGLRVPDHGALSPWKIIVFKGKSRETFGKLFLGKRFKELNPSASKDDVIQNFNKVFQTNIYDVVDTSTLNPVSDIADSYHICIYGIQQLITEHFNI